MLLSDTAIIERYTQQPNGALEFTLHTAADLCDMGWKDELLLKKYSLYNTKPTGEEVFIN